MSRITNSLSQLEDRLESLIEGGAARLFPKFGSTRKLAYLIEEALRDGIHEGSQGEQIAPDIFHLMVDPEQAVFLLAENGWSEALAGTIFEIGTSAGFIFPAQPAVKVIASDNLEPGEIKVLAVSSSTPIGETAGKNRESAAMEQEIPVNAFLIVNGTQIFSFNQTVINIGRRSDNHLVIEDSRVSRLHAQLRLISRNYFIFDLDSSGGTWVNGARISQIRLVPGDVVSLAGVPLVFGLEGDEQGETQDYHPAGLQGKTVD